MSEGNSTLRMHHDNSQINYFKKLSKDSCFLILSLSVSICVRSFYRMSGKNFSASLLSSHTLKNCWGFKSHHVLERPPKDILIPKSPWDPVHFPAAKLLPVLLLFIFVEGDTNTKKHMVISPCSLILLRTAGAVSAAVVKAEDIIFGLWSSDCFVHPCWWQISSAAQPQVTSQPFCICTGQCSEESF